MDGQNDIAEANRLHHWTIPVPQEFLFVDTAQAKTSRQGRRNARSFVMQNARRDRPWSTSKEAARQRRKRIPERKSSMTKNTPDPILTSTTSTPSPLVPLSKPFSFTARQISFFASTKKALCSECHSVLCRPGHSSCSACVLVQSPTAVADPENGVFDPFRTSSLKIDGRVSELLKHFIEEMAPGIIAIDIHHRSTLMKSDWFGTALAHPGFMHGLLCTVALHLYIFGKGNIDTILYHRARAIAAVNAAISSPDPQDGTSDANIGAVFNLLTVEESLQLPHFAPTRFYEDQPKQRAIHMNGLSRMIQLRGGLMEIQTNRILQAFILWHATTQAIFHLEAPDHSKWDYITAAGFPRHPPDYEPNISPYLVDCCRYLDIAETLITLVESVLVLTADLNVCFSDPGSALDPLDVQNFACALECMLLMWLRKHEHSSTPLEDALCMALLIFTIRTTAAMKRQSDVHLLHSAASRRLENALTCIDRTEWQNRPDLFLWISCITAISADAATDPSWLVHQAALTCEACGIHSAQALSTRLQYCGWVSYKLGKAVYILWDSIVDLRLEPPYFDDVPEPKSADSRAGLLQYPISDSDLGRVGETVDWTEW